MANASDEPWPDFLVVGVPKAGSTSIGRYLDQHPDISRVTVPERPVNHNDPRFFSSALDEVERGQRTEAEAHEWYFDLLADLDGLRMDKSVSYIWHNEAPRRIHERIPDVPIIVVFRDPVERAYSHYRMRVMAGGEDKGFLDAIEADLELEKTDHSSARYIYPGRYAEHLERYLDHFDRDQIHIEFAETMAEDTDGVLARMAEFVGADPDGVDHIDTGTRHNPHETPRGPISSFLFHDDTVKGLARALLPKRVRDFLAKDLLVSPGEKPPMPEEGKKRLVEIYRDEVHRLDEMLDEPLPWDADRWDLDGADRAQTA